ncbi:MAG: HesA/MoeB/ThiF family protein [Candidatus Bathyarchaeia archaeon]
MPTNSPEFGLTSEELELYDRQLRMPGLGIEGQKKLKGSLAVVAGIGGLGCPASLYLTAAGFGRVKIIDKDVVELSNLNRQVLHWHHDIGSFKAKSAEEKLRRLNPYVRVTGVVAKIDEKNVGSLIEGADVVIDGQDNYKTRFLLNDACIRHRIPFIHAAVQGFNGQLMTIVPGKGPCLRCLFPSPPIETKPFPILGATSALMAALQVLEAIKIVAKIGTPMIGKLLIFEGEDTRFEEVPIMRNPECSTCGKIKEV